MSNKVKTTKMNQSKQELVPKLRFPEFNDDGEWRIEELGSVCDVRDGTHDSPQFYNTGKPLITSKNLLSNGVMDLDNVSFISEEDYEKINKRSKVNIGDIVFGMIGTIGNPVLVKDSGFAIKNVALIKQKTDLLNSYLVHFLDSQYIIERFKTLHTGNTQKFIALGQIRKLSFPLPKKQEQQKIADCLSSIDDLITAESKKLEFIKNHKKGLMQNLFPPEGKTIPNFRFPEFKGDGEWEKLTLSDVYSFKVTNSFSREKLNYENGLVKNIHYGDIHTKFSTLFDITKESVPFVNLSQEIANIKTDNYCIEGDIILADASEDMNDIGKSIEIVNLNNEKLLSGLHTLLARQKKNRLKVGFGGYLFKSQCIRSQIQKEAQGAKVLGISATRLSNIKIIFPKKKQEQQKIANCLSSIDDLITAQIKKIDMLKKHKKGLMQQIFPSPDDQINHQSK